MHNRTKPTLHLADTNLIMSQRLSEWCAHGPILEQDIAITNITLDLLGQSRNFYQHAATLINEAKEDDTNVPTANVETALLELSRPDRDITETISYQPMPLVASPLERTGDEVLDPANPTSPPNNSSMHLTPLSAPGRGVGGEVTEDSLAYLRTEREFKNFLLAELPNGDWAQTITKLFFYSVYQYLLYEQLQVSKDDQLAAISAKAIKEITYHVKWSSEWVVRLGDGTDESRERMEKAIHYLWMYTGEMFETKTFETEPAVDKQLLKTKWHQKITDVFNEATLEIPADNYMQTGGVEGKHTEHLGFILAELQYLQRTYPGAEW